MELYNNFYFYKIFITDTILKRDLSIYTEKECKTNCGLIKFYQRCRPMILWSKCIIIENLKIIKRCGSEKKVYTSLFSNLIFHNGLKETSDFIKYKDLLRCWGRYGRILNVSKKACDSFLKNRLFWIIKTKLYIYFFTDPC